MPNSLQEPRSYSGISTGAGGLSPGVSFLTPAVVAAAAAAGGVAGQFDVPAHRKVNRYARVEFVNDVFDVVT
jgi:hypothetical protein